MALGQEDEGRQILKTINQSADEASFYLSRALLLDKYESQENNLKDLERALELDKAQWRTYFQISKYHNKSGDQQKAMAVLKEATKAFPGNYVLEMEMIKLLNTDGDYKVAMNLLDKIQVLPHEGAGGGRTLYESVYLNAALQDIQSKKWNAAASKIEKSRIWPENLGVGKPFDPREILQDYLAAAVNKAKNNRPQFSKYLEAVISQGDHLNSNSKEQALVVLALKHSGQEDAAEKLVDKIKKEGSPSAVANIEQLLDLAENRGTGTSQDLKDNDIVQKIIETTKSILK